ncbi:hypothetical protein D1345_17005 [Chromobacterium rhizoryzae]|uniref:Uncharacterized protein n=2 Tax=Chromobacterium rhizoryzae TaxID=1778675 RepID=A0AAD0W8W9_9NEIS|nr:hypothetical protein D1345_17005 [Chromobacterium rhizoryzae]
MLQKELDDAFYDVMRFDRKLKMYGVLYCNDFEGLSDDVDGHCQSCEVGFYKVLYALGQDYKFKIESNELDKLMGELKVELFRVEMWCSKIYNSRFDDVFVV